MTDASAPVLDWRRRAREVFGADLRSLALMRICLGLVLLADLAGRARWIPENYSERGLMPRAILERLPIGDFPSPHAMVASPQAEAALFALAAACAVLLVLGLWTRLAVLASWYLLVSLQVRNFTLQDGGDSVLVWLLLWSLFLPVGAVASLDARRRPPPRERLAFSPASVGLLLQLAMVYFYGGLGKSGAAWRDGTAVAYVLSQSYWSRPLGEYLLGFPGLLAALTYCTVVFEIAAPLLLFSPFATAAIRLVVIPLFWLFQLSLALTIELNLFPFASTLATLPFIPSRFWDWLAARLRRTPSAAAPERAPLGATAGGSPWPRRVGNGLAALLLVVSVVRSLQNLDPRLELRGPLLRAAQTLHIHQQWNMYAPGPGRLDYWFTRHGTLPDGRRIDLDAEGAGPRWERVLAAHRDYRFKLYVQGVFESELPLERRYARWLCREFNADQPAGWRVESVQVYFHARKIVLGGENTAHRSTLIVERDCGSRGERS